MASRKKRQRRPRGSGRVRKTGENQYSIGANLPRTTPDAKLQTKYATVIGTKSEAEKRLRELQREIDKGAFDVADDKITVNQLLDRFLEAKSISKEPTTIVWYRRNFATHVRGVIGTKRLADLKAIHIQSLLSNAKDQSRTKKRGQPLSGQSMRNLLVGIRASLAWGVRQGLIIRNVADMVESPRIDHSEPVVITLEDVIALLAATQGGELEAVVPFQIGTGLRRAETCGARWGDIDWIAGTIRVQRNAVNLDGKVVIKTTKSKKSKRTEPLLPSVVAILRKHRAAQAARHLQLGIGNQGPEGPVFDRFDGRAWDPNEMSRIFTRMRQRNNLPAIRLHDLRHGNATFKFAAGVPLKVVSESLGHSSIGITAAIYVHLLDETKRDAADALEGYLGSTLMPNAEASAE